MPIVRLYFERLKTKRGWQDVKIINVLRLIPCFVINDSDLNIEEHSVLVADQVECSSDGRKIGGWIGTPIQKHVQQNEFGTLQINIIAHE